MKQPYQTDKDDGMITQEELLRRASEAFDRNAERLLPLAQTLKDAEAAALAAIDAFGSSRELSIAKTQIELGMAMVERHITKVMVS